MNDKLLKLINGCKCSVSLDINTNRNYYETPEVYFEDNDVSDIDEDIVKEMIKRDSIIRIQFYPHTPIGFYIIYHYDLNKALDLALECLD